MSSVTFRFTSRTSVLIRLEVQALLCSHQTGFVYNYLKQKNSLLKSVDTNVEQKRSVKFRQQEFLPSVVHKDGECFIQN